MPELLRKLAKWREKRTIWQNFMTIQDPMPLNPDYLGGEVFADDFKEIIDIMEHSADGLEDGDNTKRWYLQFAEYMRGIAQQVASSQPNVLKLKELHDYLNELDRRRGTRWPRLYPWLINEFERHRIK